MKKLLLIALLIVGCAPTKPPTAQFYIGMTDKEFKDNNPTLIKDTDPILSTLSIHTYTEEQDKQRLISWLSKDLFSDDYLFTFKNDTLVEVARGILIIDKK